MIVRFPFEVSMNRFEMILHHYKKLIIYLVLVISLCLCYVLDLFDWSIRDKMPTLSQSLVESVQQISDQIQLCAKKGQN